MAVLEPGTQVFEIDQRYRALSRQRTAYSVILMLAVFATLVAGLMIAEEANSGSFLGGLANFFDYPADILKETYEAGWGWWGLVWKYIPYLLETLNIALLSTIIGMALGTLIAFVASRNLVGNPVVVWVMRRILDITRAFPELVIALFLIFIIGKSPLAAVAAVAFHTVGVLGKLFSEVNENADMRPVDGLAAAGATWSQRMRFGILPQVLPNYLSYALLRLEINVRASAILGFVGAGGLGQQLKAVIDWKYGDDVSAIMFLLVIAIIAIDYLSSFLRRRLIGAAH